MRKYLMINRWMLFVLTLIVTGYCSSTFAARRKTTKEVSEAIAKRVKTALTAEFAGNTDVEELLMDRSEFVGMVVKVKYSGSRCYIHSSSGDPTVYLYGNNSGMRLKFDVPKDPEAREWAIEMKRDGAGDYYYYDDVPGSSGSLYVYVEEKTLTILGERRRKKSGKYTYTW